MKAYLDILNNCLNNGTISDNRTGIKTLRIPWGATFEHDMSDGFPLVTTKKMLKDIIVRYPSAVPIAEPMMPTPSIPEIIHVADMAALKKMLLQMVK